MSTLTRFCPSQRKLPKKICICLLLFFHLVQSIMGIFHMIIVVRLSVFVWMNIDLFQGSVWRVMSFYVVVPFALCSITITYVQVSLFKSTQKERVEGMTLKEYKIHVYSAMLIVVVSVACFYLHINNQLKFNAFLQRDLKKMIFEYNNSSSTIIDQIQNRHNCCGSNDITDWINKWERQDLTPKRILEPTIFPRSCCIDAVCGADKINKINNHTRKIPSRNYLKLNGCSGVLRNKMAAIWLKNSFLMFLLPVINELVFIIMIFVSRVIRSSKSASNLEFSNEAVVLDDEDMTTHTTTKMTFEPSTNDGSINNNVVAQHLPNVGKKMNCLEIATTTTTRE